MTALDRDLGPYTARGTDRRRESFERVLKCTVCGWATGLFEANQGATSEEEHRFTDPDTFVCAECLFPEETT